jgi:DNA primase
MTRRFSPEELTILRNRVPIRCVIETLLDLPTRNRQGKLSFACPVCGGFDTSLNAAHNLARCFACRQNFNPIELVMHHLQIGFVDSVKWLKKRMPAASTHNNTHAAERTDAQPTVIGDILANMIPTLAHGKVGDPSTQSITQRLSDLEHRVRHLYRLIDELRWSLNQ